MDRVDGEQAAAEGERRRRGAAVAIYEALKRDILDMTMGPGDPLDETALSDRFGVSRTPVREALVRLVAEGLATTLPNRNTIVSALDLSTLPHYLDALTLMYRVTNRLAAARRTDAELDAIRRENGRFLEAVAAADPIAMIETNRDFHLAIAAAAGNRYYADLFARLLNEGMRLLRVYFRAFDDRLPREYAEEHDLIIAAIAARDPEEADRLGQRHARQVVAQLQSFLEPTSGVELRLDG